MDITDVNLTVVHCEHMKSKETIIATNKEASEM